VDEYGIYYQPELAGEQVRRVVRLMLIRLGWAVLSIGLVLLAWRFWPDATSGWVWWYVGLTGGWALVLLVIDLVRWRLALGDARATAQGLAIGLNRDGVMINREWLPWAEVGSVRAVPGRLQTSTRVITTSRDQRKFSVPLDFTDTMPASLDSAMRVLSAGRVWVDLSRLD
jgi:hypothetical protein